MDRVALETEALVHQVLPTLASSRHQRLTEALERLYVAFYDAVWSWSHLFVLASCGGRERRRAMSSEVADVLDPGAYRLVTSLLHGACGLGMHMARALWVVGAQASDLLGPIKKMETDPWIPNRLLREAGLAMIALASHKCRAEAIKALAAPVPVHRSGAPLSEKWEKGVLSLSRRVAASDAEAHTIYDRRRREVVADWLMEAGPPAPIAIASADDVPPDVAIATMATLEHSVAGEPTRLEDLLELLPALVRADASVLFAPRAWCPALAPVRDLDEAMSLVHRMSAAAGYLPPKMMRRAAPKIGRNDLCPCGSGKKHKRCCGG